MDPVKLFQSFIGVLRDVVPREHKTWSFHIQTTNSCYKIENANIHSVCLRGYGGENSEDIDVDVTARISIGKSYNIQLVHVHEKGLHKAVQASLDLPKNIVVCQECAKLRVGNETRCSSCLFLQLYASKNDGAQTCSICQEQTYRTVLPCGHYFHMTCLLSMDPVEAKCPNCRTPLEDDVVKQIFGDMYNSESDDDDEYGSDDDTDVS